MVAKIAHSRIPIRCRYSPGKPFFVLQIIVLHSWIFINAAVVLFIWSITKLQPLAITIDRPQITRARTRLKAKVKVTYFIYLQRFRAHYEKKKNRSYVVFILSIIRMRIYLLSFNIRREDDDDDDVFEKTKSRSMSVRICNASLNFL